MYSSVAVLQESLHVLNSKGANLIDTGSIQGFYLCTVQIGSMETGLLCQHCFKALSPPKTSVLSLLQRTCVCKCHSAEQKSSIQVLESSSESSNDEDTADENAERHGVDASEGAIGDDSNVIFYAPRHS
jgi:hypothetical protein